MVLIKPLPIAVLPLPPSYPLSVETIPKLLQYETQQIHVKRLQTGKPLPLSDA